MWQVARKAFRRSSSWPPIILHKMDNKNLEAYKTVEKRYELILSTSARCIVHRQ